MLLTEPGELKMQWKTRLWFHLLKATLIVVEVEEMKESQMNLQTVLTGQHVATFQ